MRAVSVPALGLAVVSGNRDPLLGRLRHRRFEIDKARAEYPHELARVWWPLTGLQMDKI